VIISIILSIIFFTIALIHFNWALGSEWAFDVLLPLKDDGSRLFTPRQIESFVVGVGLMLFCIYYLLLAGILSIHVPEVILKYAGWIIPSIFLIRAIGDFNYCGFFKRKKNSKFAKMDTNFFSPLCLMLSILGFIIKL